MSWLVLTNFTNKRFLKNWTTEMFHFKTAWLNTVRRVALLIKTYLCRKEKRKFLLDRYFKCLQWMIWVMILRLYRITFIDYHFQTALPLKLSNTILCVYECEVIYWMWINSSLTMFVWKYPAIIRKADVRSPVSISSFSLNANSR